MSRSIPASPRLTEHRSKWKSLRLMRNEMAAYAVAGEEKLVGRNLETCFALVTSISDKKVLG